MQILKPVFGASALALLVSAPAAWADVSAKDVWAQWQDYSARSGLTLTASGEATSGAVTTYSGVKFAMDAEDVSYVAELGELVLTENSDGTVAITTPESYPITISSKGDSPINAELSVTQEALVLTASGTPDSINYAYTADSFTVALLGVTGEEVNDTTATGALVLGKSSGKSVIGSGAVQPFSSEFTAESLGATLEIDAPSQNGAFSMTVAVADLTGTSEGSLPTGIDPEDLGAMLKAGMKAKGKLSFGASTYDLSFSDDEQMMDMSSTLGEGALDFDLTEAGMHYETSAKDIAVSVESSDLPLPISLTLAESAFGLGMPIAKSDQPQDFAFLTKVIGLEIDEALFGMIDPMEQLPRDPINIVLDLAGKANWLVDITAEDADEQMYEAGMPAELHSLDIRDLELTAIGASLTGAGAFTFNNDDLETFGGMPAPSGKIDLQLVGANKLIDTLVEMGFVPDDQAMMAKMMMGMFAKPGAGEDTLVSTVEVKEDGSVFANGQQLQ